MSDLSPALTEDMLARATAAISYVHPQLAAESARACAIAALANALDGRAVVDLPEPDDEDEYGPAWESPARRVRVEDGQVWDEDTPMDGADAEAHGLALVAAARLLAAEGGEPQMQGCGRNDVDCGANGGSARCEACTS